jgi:hypothetical protein
MNDGETQEFARPDLGPAATVTPWYAGLDTGAGAHERVQKLADPALGATPRKVHSARNADLAQITWRLGIAVLVLCALALAGLITLEIILASSLP